MLTIGKLGVTRGQLEYYEAQVAAGAEDYYAGRGESPGRWRGRGAGLIGLPTGGRIERGEFMRLMQGRNPATGQVLRDMGARSTVAALDLTFSAPKSVSVLFAIGDEELSGALLAAHERAVDAALGYLEREACVTRRGRDGMERVVGDGFIAASYRHRVSRAGDPQLHTHVVVGNLTRANGRYTALDARALFQHKSAGGAVYRAVLRAEVRARLPWVWWRQTGRGLFEIDGVGDQVLGHFSQRRVEIEQRVVELVGAGVQVSRERMQAVALSTRHAKRHAVDGGTWREQARARAAEQGLGADELAALRGRIAARAVQPAAADMTVRLSGPLGLTERHNTFARRHALAEIAGDLGQGAQMPEIEAATTRYLADTSVQQIRDDDQGQRRFTTTGLLACERMIIDGIERRRHEQTGLLDLSSVTAALQASQPALNPDQAGAVRAITSSGRGIDAVTAVAGSGKTTMIGAVAACYRQQGWSVVGAAPTARAARQLRDTAGIPADTMHTLLLRVTRAGGFARGTVLVLDEAGMAPTRLTARLFDLAEQAGAKVLAVGDPGQLGSVEAGGWLATLTTDQCLPTLATAIRQFDQSERDALQALRDHDPDTYLQHKRPDIDIHEREVSAIHALVDQWQHARARHGPTHVAMIARDNYTRELANRAARARLKTAGVLSHSAVILGGREYTLGDRIIARHNDRHHDIDNGTLATIIAIEPTAGSIVIETDAGHRRALDPAYAAAHVEHAYALTAHSAQGATFHWAAVIGRPTEFTREWAYTALSRARQQTTIHLIAEPHERDRERDQYAPPALRRNPAHIAQDLRSTMRRLETETLAIRKSIHPRRPELQNTGNLPPTSAPDPQPAAGVASGPPTVRGTAAPSRMHLGVDRLRRLAHQRRGPSLRL